MTFIDTELIDYVFDEIIVFYRLYYIVIILFGYANQLFDNSSILNILSIISYRSAYHSYKLSIEKINKKILKAHTPYINGWLHSIDDFRFHILWKCTSDKLTQTEAYW